MFGNNAELALFRESISGRVQGYGYATKPKVVAALTSDRASFTIEAKSDFTALYFTGVFLSTASLIALNPLTQTQPNIQMIDSKSEADVYDRPMPFETVYGNAEYVFRLRQPHVFPRANVVTFAITNPDPTASVTVQIAAFGFKHYWV